MTKKQQETAQNDVDESLAAQVVGTLPEWITQLIQINTLIANRMGVVATDFHCLHALHQDGPATASVLAGRVGLTPGSTSRMIDRLADAGCVKRVPDPGDRRRIVIEPTAEGLDRITTYYAGLTARTHGDLADFDDDQLRTLLRFVEAARDSAIAEVDRLRSAQPDE
ncbi:MarR family winged helix-turn-helix transcriptional regulator [Streptomyces resistomycificus]|uniref:MarR family transcriptional regulator n=1 Tax=Streptomyces resistomycificus TaxID=67356 RepID=A0A0L8L2J1_9ACTN|nr:MarR family transcriptional regulator [Streptomyces resistomycificus]KOG32281.1 MarR family transcriptional regulator [Streptomyces resistomycificus]KUN94635.1 MarR family transcriptional regulator [Streptomyces resistomycificus]